MCRICDELHELSLAQTKRDFCDLDPLEAFTVCDGYLRSKQDEMNAVLDKARDEEEIENIENEEITLLFLSTQHLLGVFNVTEAAREINEKMRSGDHPIAVSRVTMHPPVDVKR